MEPVSPKEQSPPAASDRKRPYRPPQLIEYGSVEALVDAGAVQIAITVPDLM
jgi:hypothetical protein